MKKLRSFSFGTWLLIIAALVNVSRWVGVFTFSNHVPVVLDFISGLSMGLVMAGGIAFIFHRLGKMQPFTPKGKPIVRFWLSAVVGLAILGLSVFLLPPYMIATMPEKFKEAIPNPGLWSAIAVLAADLLVVAIATVDSKAAGFTSNVAEQKEQQKSKGKRTAKPKSRSKIMKEQVACKWGCGLTGTKAAMNAHSKFCAKNPANQFEQAAKQGKS